MKNVIEQAAENNSDYKIRMFKANALTCCGNAVPESGRCG